jgi:hypothetical protein
MTKLYLNYPEFLVKGIYILKDKIRNFRIRIILQRHQIQL